MKRTHCDLCEALCPQVGHIAVDFPMNRDRLKSSWSYELCPKHTESLRQLMETWLEQVREEVRQAALVRSDNGT